VSPLRRLLPERAASGCGERLARDVRRSSTARQEPDGKDSSFVAGTELIIDGGYLAR
jgi:hypothetical protein